LVDFSFGKNKVLILCLKQACNDRTEKFFHSHPLFIFFTCFMALLPPDNQAGALLSGHSRIGLIAENRHCAGYFSSYLGIFVKKEAGYEAWVKK